MSDQTKPSDVVKIFFRTFSKLVNLVKWFVKQVSKRLIYPSVVKIDDN